MFLAHLGGIDEIGIFVVPALLAIAGLRLADRRARARRATNRSEAGPDSGGENSTTLDLPSEGK